MLRFLNVLMSPADDGGDGGGSTGGDGRDGAIHQQMQNLLRRHDNDWAAVATQLFTDNYQLRSDRRELRKELKTAQEQVPEGVTVLEGEELKRYERYKELGEPDKVASSLSELSNLQRREQLRAMAEKHELKESAVRNLLPEGAEIVKQGEGDDASYALKVGDKTTSVNDLLEGDWKEFVPVLKPEENPTKRRVLGQRGDVDGGKQDLVSEYLANQNGQQASASATGAKE